MTGAAFFGLLLLAVLGAWATYPSWQLGLSSLCVAGLIPLQWYALGRQLAPLAPGTTAKEYVESAVPTVACVVLFVVASVVFSTAPI